MNYQNDKNYRDTELGFLPVSWNVVRLGDYINKKSEKNIKNQKINVYTVSNKYGFIESDKFFNKRVYSKKLNTYKIIKNNYFAYNPYRVNVGSIALFKKDIGCVSPAYIVFKINNENLLHPDFLYQLITSPFYMNEIMRYSMSKGSVRRSLSFDDLSEFKIPLPPISEQKKIIFISSIVNNSLKKTEQIINSLKEFKKSFMKHVFTYGLIDIRKIEKVNLKETELGQIPENWKICKLKDCIINTQYGLSIKSNKQGKYPMLGMNHLGNGKISVSDINFVNLDNSTFDKFKLKKGDVLFNRTNSLKLVGKTSIFELNDNYVFASYLIRIQVNKEELDPYFLTYYFNMQKTQIELKKLASRGVSQSNISASKLKKFDILLPSLNIQKEISEYLKKIDTKLEAEIKRVNNLNELKKSIMHYLINAKIRVNDIKIGDLS